MVIRRPLCSLIRVIRRPISMAPSPPSTPSSPPPTRWWLYGATALSVVSITTFICSKSPDGNLFHAPWIAQGPYAILEDIYAGFVVGTGGSLIYSLAKGVYYSPKGERLVGGIKYLKLNNYGVGHGIRLAALDGVYAASLCTITYFRLREDAWNSIAAGVITGALCKIRSGFGAASRAALFGGLFFAIFESYSLVLEDIHQVRAKRRMAQEEQWRSSRMLPVKEEGKKN